MSEKEIAPTDWATFGTRFTDQHRGWLISATRRTARGVEHRIWRDAALERVSMDVKTGNIVCSARTVEQAGGALVSIASETPRRMFALLTDDGCHEGLRVETADGGVTELRFRIAVAPETVDGISYEA